MELAIIAVLAAVGIWFFFFRNKKIDEGTNDAAAPYKIEPPILEKSVSVPTQEVTPEPVTETKTEEKPKKSKKAPKSTAKAEVATKRARKGGKFVGDDKSTSEVNEAFKDGKSPKKPKMEVAK